MTASGTSGDLRNTLPGVYVRLRGRSFTIDEGPLQSAAQRRRAHGRRILVGQKHSVATDVFRGSPGGLPLLDDAGNARNESPSDSVVREPISVLVVIHRSEEHTSELQ